MGKETIVLDCLLIVFLYGFAIWVAIAIDVISGILLGLAGSFLICILVRKRATENTPNKNPS